MSQVKLIEPHLSLDVVTQNFARWRSRRKSRSIPPELMDQALSLLDHYPITRITTALKFNHSDFKEKCRNNGLIPTETTFVQVQTEVTNPHNDIHIEVCRTDGVKMSLYVSKIAAASQLIEHFLRG